MVEIQSKEVIDKMSDELKVQPALLLPRELGKMIVPVYNVNPPRNIRVASSVASDSVSATVMTASLTKRTFIIGCSVTIAKSALSDSIFSILQANIKNQFSTTSLLTINYEPSTAGSFTESLTFSEPIEITPGTAISIANNAATASIDTRGTVYFFETDPQ